MYYVEVLYVHELLDSVRRGAQARHLAILTTGPQYCFCTAAVNSASTWGTVICQHWIWTMYTNTEQK